jgi:hypothetical protein
MKVAWVVLAAATLAVASGEEGVIDFTEAIQTLEQSHAQIDSHLERYAREAMESFHASQTGKESVSQTLERYARKSQESVHASQTGKDWDAWISVSQAAWCITRYRAECLYASGDAELRPLDTPQCRLLLWCPPDLSNIFAKWEDPQQELTAAQMRILELAKAP